MRTLRSTLLAAALLAAIPLATPALAADTVALLPAQATSSNPVELFRSTPTFTTMAGALGAAGLADQIASGGPYTIFAVPNAAFAAIPRDKFLPLLQSDHRDQLASLLKMHVVQGAYSSDKLTDGMTLKTLSGATLTVHKTADGITVNGVKVVEPDVKPSMGVIHVVDAILQPQ